MADEAVRTYQIGLARVRHDPNSLLFAADAYSELAASWPINATVTRYGRTWRLTRLFGETEDFAFAKLGFVNDHEVSTLHFDEATQEFVYGDAPSGIVVPFAIRKNDLVIAYQLRSGIVRETTFTSALQQLLSPGRNRGTWTVEAIVRIVELKAWRQSVTQVVQVDVAIERPNPHYGKNDAIESLIEQTNSEVVRISAKALAGESLDLDYPLFDQALDHVQKNYGRAKLVGVESDGTESIFVKSRGSSAAVPARRRFTAYGGQEVPEAALATELNEPLPSGTEAAAIYEADGNATPA